MQKDIDLESYRTHTLIPIDEEQNDTVPLLDPRITEKKSGGFFGFFSNLFTQSVPYEDTSKCSICQKKMYCIIEGVPYCKVYADILIGRKNKSIPVSCRYDGACIYPECDNSANRFLYDSVYVTEGYYCLKHIKHIDFMIMQENTVQYVLKRSKKITKYSDIRAID